MRDPPSARAEGMLGARATLSLMFERAGVGRSLILAETRSFECGLDPGMGNADLMLAFELRLEVRYIEVGITLFIQSENLLGGCERYEVERIFVSASLVPEPGIIASRLVAPNAPRHLRV